MSAAVISGNIVLALVVVLSPERFADRIGIKSAPEQLLKQAPAIGGGERAFRHLAGENARELLGFVLARQPVERGLDQARGDAAGLEFTLDAMPAAAFDPAGHADVRRGRAGVVER